MGKREENKIPCILHYVLGWCVAPLLLEGFEHSLPSKKKSLCFRSVEGMKENETFSCNSTFTLFFIYISELS